MSEKQYDESGNCKHLNWDCQRANFGICVTCREERQFSNDGKSFNVVRPGVPRRPDTKRTSVLHEYYINNHEAIIRDYLDLGLKPMLERWEMSSGTWPGLKSDWIKRGWMTQTSVNVKKPETKTEEMAESREEAQMTKLVVKDADNQDVTLVKCEDCQMFSRHMLMDESGTVLIHSCAFNITLPVAIDSRALRRCDVFQQRQIPNEGKGGESNDNS